MTDHPLTETRAAELWDQHRDKLAIHNSYRFELLHWTDRPTALAAMRAAYDAGRADAQPTDPFRDHRYVPCGPEFYYQEPGWRRGIWDRQTGEVAWFSSPEDSPAFLTRLAERIDVGVDSRGEWVWSPAHTPPAEEVELPDAPRLLTDVVLSGGEKIAYMALDSGGHWCGVDQEGIARSWPLRWLAAFTLPDGTRARRDGAHEDGTPRFVKEDA